MGITASMLGKVFRINRVTIYSWIQLGHIREYSTDQSGYYSFDDDQAAKVVMLKALTDCKIDIETASQVIYEGKTQNERITILINRQYYEKETKDKIDASRKNHPVRRKLGPDRQSQVTDQSGPDK